MMRNAIPIRGWRCAILYTLFGIVLSGASLADSTGTSTASSPKTPPKPPTTQSKATSASSSSSTTTPKKRATSKSASHKSTGQTTASHRKKGSKNQRSSRKRGQQAIDHERALAIQQALIREHYLQGAPSGTWDATTQGAMQRYQADQGWQSKTTPDSRALIKLGLGPSNDHLLNPESAMTSAPPAGGSKAATKPTPAQSNLPH
jgi:hypothetical protein